MQIQTFSVVVGTPACDAGCQFCISKITGFDQLPSEPGINFPRFRKAVDLARLCGCTTILFTGKGEPTLYPLSITKYLECLDGDKYQFPFQELQTNAIRIGLGLSKSNLLLDRLHNELGRWIHLGLTTIAISTTGVRQEWNQETYLHHRSEKYPDLGRTVDFLHKLGYSVRICVMMRNGMVDSPEKVMEVVQWCKNKDVEQLTIRPIRRPSVTPNNGTTLTVLDQYTQWIDKHGLSQEQEELIRSFVATNGTHLLSIMQGAHQAKIFDLDGQNICVTDCLTVEPSYGDIRTLIFFGDGQLSYDWHYRGARLL